MTSIIIPSNVTNIGDYAFYGCTGLTEISFNATVMNNLNENNYVFYCAGRGGAGIAVTIGANVTRIPSYLFYPCSSSYVPNVTSVVFENGSVCESIGNYAFAFAKSLKSVTFEGSSNLQSIGNRAFYICTSLENITIPSTVTSINECAFAGCSKLASIVFYENSKLESIGNDAFYGTSIVSITIPSSVKSIGTRAFYDCSKLTSVTFEDTSTWYYTDTKNHNFTGGTQITLGTANENATLLKSTYYSKYWYKIDE